MSIQKKLFQLRSVILPLSAFVLLSTQSKLALGSEAIPFVYNVQGNGVDVTCRYPHLSNIQSDATGIHGSMGSDLEYKFHFSIDNPSVVQSLLGGNQGGLIRSSANVRETLCPTRDALNNGFNSVRLQEHLTNSLKPFAAGNVDPRISVGMTNRSDTNISGSFRVNRYGCSGNGQEVAFVPAFSRQNNSDAGLRNSMRQQYCEGLKQRLLVDGMKKCLALIETVLTVHQSAGGAPSDTLSPRQIDAALGSNRSQLSYCQNLDSYFGMERGQAALEAVKELFSTQCTDRGSISRLSEEYPRLVQAYDPRHGAGQLHSLIQRVFGDFANTGTSSSLSFTINRYLGHREENERNALASASCPNSRLVNQLASAGDGNVAMPTNVGGTGKPCNYNFADEMRTLASFRLNRSTASPAQVREKDSACQMVKNWRMNYYRSCEAWARAQGNYSYLPSRNQAPDHIVNARYVACECGRSTQSLPPLLHAIRFGGPLRDGESCLNYASPSENFVRSLSPETEVPSGSEAH